MTNYRNSTAAIAIAACALATATPALAAGTQSGTTVTNNVSVSYQVGGVDQIAETTTNTFVVDQKVSLVVAETAPVQTTSISPGQTSVITAFTLTNLSNDTLDFGLEATQPAGGPAVHDGGATDTFNVSNIRIYIDADSSGTITAGDIDITSNPYIDELAADDSVDILVVADAPLGLTSGDVAVVTLTATAQAGGTASTEGAVLTATTTPDDPNAIDTVFADTSAGGNIASDGKSFASDDYTVSAAGITAVKTSYVVSDPINSTTNPKAIPGAIVEYCIRVDNSAGSATATNVTVSDDVPTTLSQTGAINITGPVTSPTDPCTSVSVGNGSITGNTVSGTLPDLNGGESAALVFQAEVL